MLRRILLIAALLASASSAFAQTDTSAVNRRLRLLQRLHAGTPVRLLLNGAPAEGTLRRVSNDTVYFGDYALPAAQLDSVWLQQRATSKGAKLGAIIGAPAGAAFGGFIMLLVSALCESEGDCGDLSTGEVAIGITAFGAAGAVAGGILGGVIGAATPQWVEITSERAQSVLNARARSRTIGSISLTPAVAAGAGADGAGIGARLAYLFHTTHFSFGPEVGYYGTGKIDQVQFVNCGGAVCEDTARVNRHVSHFGGLARIGTSVDRAVEPYATVGVGFYNWASGDYSGTGLGGFSLGGGVQLRDQTRRRSVFVDARYHDNLTRSGDPVSRYNFYTFGLGASLAW